MGQTIAVRGLSSRATAPTSFISPRPARRGALAKIRLRNQMAPGTEGGWTQHQPDGEQMYIYDASVQHQNEGPQPDIRRFSALQANPVKKC